MYEQQRDDVYPEKSEELQENIGWNHSFLI